MAEELNMEHPESKSANTQDLIQHGVRLDEVESNDIIKSTTEQSKSLVHDLMEQMGLSKAKDLLPMEGASLARHSPDSRNPAGQDSTPAEKPSKDPSSKSELGRISSSIELLKSIIEGPSRDNESKAIGDFKEQKKSGNRPANDSKANDPFKESKSAHEKR